MKKIFLFFSLLTLCCASTYAQLNFVATPSTVTTGDVVTFTAAGESSIGYYIYVSSVTLTGSNSVSITKEGDASWYNLATNTPSKFKYKITSTSTSEVDVNIIFIGTINNNVANTQNHDWRTTTSLKVKPKAPTVYYNSAKSQTFYNNTCGAGYESEPYIYQVAANTYSSTVSQEDANLKAQNDINTNGQNAANANRPCKPVYYNAPISGVFIKNSCGSGYKGSTETYNVPAGKHKSLLSQADANSKASIDLNNNGQTYVNSIGTCIEVRKRYRAVLRPDGACSTDGEINTFIWIRNDLDLNYNNNVNAYTSETGDNPTPAGNYKIMYLIDSSIPDNGYRVFNVNDYGLIQSFTLCTN